MKIDLNTIPVEMGSTYPTDFQSAVVGRSRQRVSNAAGLKKLGVNLTTLEPGAQSALRHWHSAQDEFIYIVRGELVLITDSSEQILRAGEMAGFASGVANGHHLVNRTETPSVYLEVGDRVTPDEVNYPDHDLVCTPTPIDRQFVHNDGRPY